MAIEKLKFNVNICPKTLISKNKKPEFTITIDDKVYIHNTELGVNSAEDSVTISFEAELEFGPHVLAFNFLNKDSKTDTQSSQGKILDDLYIQINKVEIDDIDLSSILSKIARYDLVAPVQFNDNMVSTLYNHRFLSWNGAYKIPFETPFYKWLLDQF